MEQSNEEFERQERERIRVQERNEKWDKVLNDFSDLVNNFNYKDQAEGFIQSFGKQHRTLQQSMMRVMFANIEYCASPEYRTDARNQATQNACNIMVDAYKKELKEFFKNAKPSQGLETV